jgi:hypothetical protein
MSGDAATHHQTDTVVCLREAEDPRDALHFAEPRGKRDNSPSAYPRRLQCQYRYADASDSDSNRSCRLGNAQQKHQPHLPPTLSFLSRACNSILPGPRVVRLLLQAQPLFLCLLSGSLNASLSRIRFCLARRRFKFRFHLGMDY